MWNKVKFYRKNKKEAEKLRNKLYPPKVLFLSSDSDSEYDDNEI